MIVHKRRRRRRVRSGRVYYLLGTAGVPTDGNSTSMM